MFGFGFGWGLGCGEVRVFCVCVGRVCERFGGCPPPAIYLGTIVLPLFRANGKGSGTWPSSQAFSEHNGNEHRQSYHALANGFGVALESPTEFAFNPMQINTRNPDGSGERCGDECPLPRRQTAWKGGRQVVGSTRVPVRHAHDQDL